ncbi:MAG: hypothetical protein WCP28_02595 [Actinomycetes bacterium]
MPDLGIRPPDPKPYRPPPAEVCSEKTYPISLGDGTNELVVRMRRYKHFIVDFSVHQVHVDEDGKRHDVARIDCCTVGTIHRHQFVKSTGEDVYDHRTIQPIPADDPWPVVSSGYDQAIDVMMDEWEENLGRWRDG